MKDREGQRQAPACPSCGQPVRIDPPGINDKVKTLLVVILLGYVLLSAALLAMSSPPELRRDCGPFEWRWHLPYYTPDPERCKDTEFTLRMEKISRTPAFQIFVGGGMVTGALILYWDWFQERFQNWRKKREQPGQEVTKKYRYECRNCGKQWN